VTEQAFLCEDARLSDSPTVNAARWDQGQFGGIVGLKQDNSHRPMLSPLSNRHRHSVCQLVPASSGVRRRGLDHQVRQAVSIAAAVAALLAAVLSSSAPEMQAVDVPALQAKS
jgi:hypothetical protein